MPVVISLHCYPVKGCAAVTVIDSVVTVAGLAHDRSFMVTDIDGVFRSQRNDPSLAVVQPEVTADGRRLSLRANGFGEVSIDVRTEAARRPVLLFGAPFTGIDQGDEVAAWLSDVLGKRSRLVRVPPEHDRVTDGANPGTSGYADSSAVHLLSLASFADLNERITANGGTPIELARLRPNIVVDGWSQPHVEDALRRLTVGEVELAYTKLAIRCAVTLVDQRTGMRAGPEPIRTLAGYRRASSGGVAFGTKFSVTRPGKLSVGDQLAITEWGDAEL